MIDFSTSNGRKTATSRFYTHFDGDPHFNMAFDEWMLGQAAAQPGRVLARLYTWQVGTITFGVNQRQDTLLDPAHLGRTPLIRRVTGGRAVYHDRSELTYAVAINPLGTELEGVQGSVSKTYERLAQGLQDFLQRSGILAKLVTRSHAEDRRPRLEQTAPCFASAARHELMSEGRKVIASAQRQFKGVILQHGAIKLNGIAAHPALSAVPGTVAEEQLQEVDKKAFERYAQHLRVSLEGCLGVEFDTAELSDTDTKCVEELTEWVRKNSQSRRDPIKQTCSAKSL